MAKRLFKWIKRSHRNIECGYNEYIHRSSSELPLGAISLAGASLSGVTMALTKKYKEKLMKVTKLYDIVTSATAVFETCLSKA